MDVTAYITHTHHTCALFAFTGCSAQIFLSLCLKADKTPGSLYTGLSKLRPLKKRQGTIWIPEIHCFKLFPRRQIRNFFFFFLITEPSELFGEAFELLLNVICLMLGSVKGEAANKLDQCWKDLLPTPLLFNQISLSSSVGITIIIELDIQRLTNRNKANNIIYPLSRHPKECRATRKELYVFHCLP